MCLSESIVESKLACSRKAKALPLEALRERVVFVDGYNVLITVESLLAGYPIYQCDDGFLRDTRGDLWKLQELKVHDLCHLCDPGYSGLGDSF